MRNGTVRCSLSAVFLGIVLVVAAAACEGGGGEGSGADASAADAAALDASAGDAAADAGAGAPDGRDAVAPDGPGAGEDAGGADVVAADVPTGVDAAPDAGPLPDVVIARPCDPSAVLGTTIDPVPDGPAPLIHPHLAFDGHALWLGWNQVEPGGSTFDVWGARYACDGAPSVPPFRVQADSAGNDVNPVVSAAGDAVLFAWSSDTGGDPNLFARWRVFGRDGRPRGGDKTLVPQPGGEPASASAWLVTLAPDPAGGWALAGSWAAPVVQRFQVFYQALDATGAAVGPFVTGPEEAEVGHGDPSVTVAADGTPYVAWTRQTDQGTMRAEHAPVVGEPPAFGAPVPATPPEGFTLSSQGPSVAAAPAASGPLWLAFGQRRVSAGNAEVDVVLRDAAAAAPQVDLVLGAARVDDFAPIVTAAPDGDGGLVVWYRSRAGYDADVWAQRFRAGAEGPVAEGAPLLLNPPDEAGAHDALAVYSLTVAALPDDVWAVAWTEGESPDLRLRLRFLGHAE